MPNRGEEPLHRGAHLTQATGRGMDAPRGHAPDRPSASSRPRVHFPQRRILSENSFLRDPNQKDLRGNVGIRGVLSPAGRCEKKWPLLPVRNNCRNTKLELQEQLLQRGREAEGKTSKLRLRQTMCPQGHLCSVCQVRWEMHLPTEVHYNWTSLPLVKSILTGINQLHV